jgi:hypothetical protein
MEEERILPLTLYLVSFTMISKPDKDTTKNETHRLIHLMHIDANILNDILAN